MQIDISKLEYKTLLNILEIADWVLNAYKTEKDPRTRSHWKLEQKLLSYAEAMGYGDLVDSSLGEFMPTRKYEDTISAMGFIEEFENDTFWDELIDRLAMRDLIEEVGADALENMPFKERFERGQPLEQKYSEEFEKNGLENLRVAGESENR